jgi:DHA2 family multidrug resistance protein-like MFS transporter
MEHIGHILRLPVADPGESGSTMTAPVDARRRTIALAVVCLAAFTTALDMTITNVALPFLARDLGASTSQLQWIVGSYNIVLAGLLLLGGGLGDRFGRKPAFLTGYALFGLASLACAFSTSPELVIAARSVMGVGAALVLTPALAIVTVMYPPAERGRAIALWAIFGAVGLAAGPAVGGVLLDRFWWGSVFFVTVPVVALGVVAGIFMIPDSRKPGSAPIDLPGAFLSVAGMGTFLFGVIEGPDVGWSDPATVATLVLGAVLLAAFVLWELHTDHPMVDVRVLRVHRVAPSAVALMLVYFTLSGMLFLVPQYLQFVRDQSVLTTGLALVPFATAFGIVSKKSPAFLERYGGRLTISLGLLLSGLGLAGLALLPETPGWIDVVIGTVVAAIGWGLLVTPATTVSMNALPVEKAGDGSAVNMVSRFAGAAFGVAVLGSVFATVYAARIAEAVRGLGASQRSTAQHSIAGADAVATRLPGASRAALTVAAQHAFADGAQIAFAAAALAAFLGAIWAARSLRERRADRGAAAPGTQPAEATRPSSASAA